MPEEIWLGKYKLGEELGRGGYGTIYKAEDTSLHVDRAIKILHPALNTDPVFIERFRQEARTAASLEHPNIVPVYDLGQHEGAFFLVMRLMKGGSIKDLLEKQDRMPIERSLAFLGQIADGLDFAHGLPEKLIHRDIKPGNILLDSDGSARISDFGFSKALEGASSVSISATGGMIGTPSYMAPELWTGKPVGPETDIYALACMFYELLAGRLLFKGNSPAEIMTQHVLQGPSLKEYWPEEVPDSLRLILERALATERSERFHSAGEFSGAVGQALAGPSQPQVPVIPEEVDRDITEKPSPAAAEASPQVVESPPVRPEPRPEPDQKSPPPQKIETKPPAAKPKQPSWLKRVGSILGIGLAGLGGCAILVLIVFSIWQPGGVPEPTPPPFEPTEVSEPTSPPLEPTEEPLIVGPQTPGCSGVIKVGLITDATGAWAIYGEQVVRSFMLGMEFATGATGSAGATFGFEGGHNIFSLDACEIEVIVVDAGSDPETAAYLAQSLIEFDMVDVLVGSLSSGVTSMVQAIAAENEVVFIVASVLTNDLTGIYFNEHTFRTSQNSYQDAVNLCQYLSTAFHTFAQISPDIPIYWELDLAYQDACTEAGGTFVADEFYSPETTDFAQQLLKIQASGAEVLLANYGPSMDMLLRQSVEMGISEDIAISTTFVDNNNMLNYFSAAIGITGGTSYHYTLPDNAINSWLASEMMNRYGFPPDFLDADGMNAAILLVESLKMTGGDTRAAGLIPIMETMVFEGPKGLIEIRPEDHVAIQDMYIVSLDNVNDPDFRFFNLIATTRPEPPCLLPEDLAFRCGDLPYGRLSGK